MRKLLRKLRAMWGNDITSARESVRHALRVVARRQAEADYHAYLVKHHTAEANAIDPHQDWNTFADEKQKAYDHDLERQVEARKVTTATAKLNAAKARMQKLQAA